MAVDDPVGRHARELPGALALRADGRDLNYAQLEAAVAATARSLTAAGVGAGDRVATSFPPGVDFAALLHALPRLGATLVPLPPRLTAAERDRLLELASPRLVLDAPLDGSRAAGPPPPAPRLDPDAPHTLLFTSGTTAAPTPVALTYANHLASARAAAANLGLKPGDRWLCPLPVHHVGGLAILLRSAIHGTAAILHPRFDVDDVRRSLESGEATLVSLVATQLQRLAEAGLERAPALRAALVGGGPVPRELLAWAADRGLPVLQTYGMTETASQIATLPAAEALASERRGSAGRPLPGAELKVEPDTGEILVRGPMVSLGALAADGWLHTGDRGSLDRDGYLWVEGRLDDTIVTGGENVAAAEVEEALIAHPALVEAAVTGRADPEWGEAIVAYVVLDRRMAPPSDPELAAHCRRRLAPHKVPKEVHRVAALPRTASGKVARARLAAEADAGPGGGPPEPRVPGRGAG
jgi:O-succinylbenzoic acid--CoA ligase